MLWKPYNKEYVPLAVPTSSIKYFFKERSSNHVYLKWLTELFFLLCKADYFSTISLDCRDIKMVFSTFKGRNANWIEALEAELRTLSILGRAGSLGGWKFLLAHVCLQRCCWCEHIANIGLYCLSFHNSDLQLQPEGYQDHILGLKIRVK